VPDIFNFALLIIDDGGRWTAGNQSHRIATGRNRVIKAVEDFVLSLLLLVVAAPLMLLIAVGVKLSSPGPVFYMQERVTWNGRNFRMKKFRTMPVGTEAKTGPVWAVPGEHRATRFGAFLRRSSLDELPQLLNVLAGDMSLVGPRPERPNSVQFRQQIPGYMQKHWSRRESPAGRRSTTCAGPEPARRIDLYYIDNWSLLFDLRILCLTLWHILTSRNAH
jgi:putative colanic acid biosynthesis UDP-glucose lipid carrier transferase